MLNKAFLQLSDAERMKKFDAVIRKNTENLLDAEQIKTLVKGVNPNCQYTIAVYPTKKEFCEASIYGNVLCIYIPEQQKQQIKRERE